MQQTQKWDRFKHLFKRMEVPSKTVLLAEGKISRNMFFLEKGCLRSWVDSNGKDITTQFFFEGDTVASIESFRSNQPSLYSIESIEPCVLQTISQKDFQDVLQSSQDLQMEMQEHLFKRLLQSQNLFFSFLKNTPQQRYEDLIDKHPKIIHRIPQHYIASYLGITSVSLSRIRNRR